MKKITFKELQDLVANIDPALDGIVCPTYPIFFSVINGKDKNYFSASVTLFYKEELPDYPDFCDSEFYKDDYATDEEEKKAYDEYNKLYPMAKLENQYIQVLVSYADYNKNLGEVLDAQIEDNMIYHQIGEMLKKKCGIDENSTIIFYEHRSFNSKMLLLDYEDVIDSYPNFFD